jgi:hypothetical protein
MLFSDRNDNPVGSVIPAEDFSTAKGNNAVHFFRHLFGAKKMKFLAGSHLIETCPHVFKTPSAVLSVINVYTRPLSRLSHYLMVSVKW